MERYYRICCVLVLAVVSKTSGGTLGRTEDIEDNSKNFYENNPFLKSSFPTEHGHAHYHNHHHRHDIPDYDERASSDINFPEYQQHQEFLENNFKHKFPQNPKITTRRDVAEEEFPNYPYEEIRKYLDDNPILRKYFAEVPVIGNRDGTPEDVDDGEDLCKMQVVRTYHPKTLKNINNVERIIVNDERDYTQAVEESRCVTGQCNVAFDTYGYTSYCHQNIGNKRLMVYENKTKQIVFDEFKFPSCCVCKIKRIK